MKIWWIWDLGLLPLWLGALDVDASLVVENQTGPDDDDHDYDDVDDETDGQIDDEVDDHDDESNYDTYDDHVDDH